MNTNKESDLEKSTGTQLTMQRERVHKLYLNVRRIAFILMLLLVVGFGCQRLVRSMSMGEARTRLFTICDYLFVFNMFLAGVFIINYRRFRKELAKLD